MVGQRHQGDRFPSYCFGYYSGLNAFPVWNLFFLLLFHFSLQDAKIEPEEFTSRLQAELKSSPQPYLVPFLKVGSISHLQTHFSNAHSPLLPQQRKRNCVTSG